MDEELRIVLSQEDGWEKLLHLYQSAIEETKYHEQFVHRMIYLLAALFTVISIVLIDAELEVQLFGFTIEQMSLVAYIALIISSVSYYLLVSRTFQLTYVASTASTIFEILYPEIKNKKLLSSFHPRYLIKAERILNKYYPEPNSIININNLLVVSLVVLYLFPGVLIVAFHVFSFYQYGYIGFLTWISIGISGVFTTQSLILLYYGIKLPDE